MRSQQEVEQELTTLRAARVQEIQQAQEASGSPASRDLITVTTMQGRVDRIDVARLSLAWVLGFTEQTPAEHLEMDARMRRERGEQQL